MPVASVGSNISRGLDAAEREAQRQSSSSNPTGRDAKDGGDSRVPGSQTASATTAPAPIDPGPTPEELFAEALAAAQQGATTNVEQALTQRGLDPTQQAYQDLITQAIANAVGTINPGETNTAVLDQIFPTNFGNTTPMKKRGNVMCSGTKLMLMHRLVLRCLVCPTHSTTTQSQRSSQGSVAAQISSLLAHVTGAT